MATEYPEAKVARLHRMVMPNHVCPYGLKAKWLLQTRGFVVDDHHLRTRLEVEQFKRKYQVKATPQIFIDGQRVGGYEDLRRYLSGKPTHEQGTSYAPIIAVLVLAALAALAIGVTSVAGPLAWTTLQRFGALFILLLAALKLRDIESFSTVFLHYDLLGRQWVPYAYIYPFAEGAAGLLMLANGRFADIGGIIGIFIGTIGAISVFKTVYIDRQELHCACVGGDSRVPLGVASLLENFSMVAMGGWMLLR